jgi:deoxyinosine 3'endonuclease (endonuclease V)
MNEDALKAQWINEQLLIASKVIILPDPKPIFTTTTIDCNDKDRFVEIDITDPSLTTSSSDDATNDSIRINHKYYYGGVDVSFPEDKEEVMRQHDNEHSKAVAVYVIIEYPSMNIIYKDYEYFHLTIPYISSFLAFREIEPIVSLIQKQITIHPKLTPSIIFVDGNGILHPRHAGFACFVGVRTGIPTIGIGKTLFCEDGITKEFVSNTISNSISSAVRYYQTVATDCKNSTNEAIHNSSILLFDRYIDQPTKDKYNTDTENSQHSNDHHNKNVSTNVENRTQFIQELSNTTNCIGVAIPLRGNQSNDILAYALVGHGGFNISRSSSCEKQGQETNYNKFVRVSSRNMYYALFNTYS